MEHRKKGRKLKRTASHRKALLSNLCISLIKHKRITTTLAKAKELRSFIEPLLTKAKKASKSPEAYVHYAREIRKFLRNREAITIILKEIGPKVLERNGGYTRVIKSGFRIGDGGETAIIELVDFSVVESTKTESKTSPKKTEKHSKKTSGKKEITEGETEKPKKKAAEKKTPKEKVKHPKSETHDKPLKKTEKKTVAKRTTARKKSDG